MSATRGTRRTVVLAATLLPAVPAIGTELVSDRPDFTESAVTVPPGLYQLETGGTFVDGDEAEAWSLGELLLRAGLAPAVELRLGLPSWHEAGSSATGDSGWQDATLGAKLALRRGAAPRRPAAAVIVETTLPTGDDGVGADRPQPGALLALAWELPRGLEVAANAGMTSVLAEGGRRLEGAGSVAVGFELGGRWAGFVEGFATVLEGGDLIPTLDAGVTRAVGRDLQLDLRAGRELAGDEAAFAGAGLVARW